MSRGRLVVAAGLVVAGGVAAGSYAGLLSAPSAGARPAGAQAAPPQIVLKLVGKIDDALSEAIKLAEEPEPVGGAGDRSDRKLEEAISRVIALKRELESFLPAIWGLSFKVVYAALEELDSDLASAIAVAEGLSHERVDYLERAIRAKAGLEKDLKRAKSEGEAVPEKLLEKLARFDRKLKRIRDRASAGDLTGRELAAELRGLESEKHALLFLFPDVYGPELTFSDVFFYLDTIDRLLDAARFDVNIGIGRSSIVKTLKKAEEAKKEFEARLQKAACPPGKYLAGVGSSRPCPSETLTVSIAGTGAGALTSSPAGIDCSATCSHAFLFGTKVSLTAAPAIDSVFSGFGGDCSGMSCTVTMNTAHAVTATFDKKRFQLRITTQGPGGVQAGVQGQQPSINCPPNSTPDTQGCSGLFDAGTRVYLLAIPANRAQFTGWQGDCTGTQNPCTLTMDADKTVTASFG